MNAFKERPFLFLIIFPLCYALSFYSIPKLFEDFGYLLYLIPFACLGLSIEYCIKPAKQTAKAFFNRHGHERAIHDYSFLRKLIIILIPITVTFSIITRIWFMSGLDWENYFLSPEFYFNSFSAALGVMIFATSGRLGLMVIKKKLKEIFTKIPTNCKIFPKILRSGISFQIIAFPISFNLIS